jgi:hypothetical protein
MVLLITAARFECTNTFCHFATAVCAMLRMQVPVVTSSAQHSGATGVLLVEVDAAERVSRQHFR